MLTVVADVRQRPEIDEAVAAAVRQWGRVDVLANIAGVAAEEHFLSITAESWQRIIDINLTGSFNVAQSVAQQMVQQGGGVILNMASKNGITAEVKYAQDHIGILSGLYGLLRPLDAMQPYRLEMGTSVDTERGENLYGLL
ncbi:MAG: peroxide stress protein YaaA, partial [Rhodobacteraceae bacterium]|nr:peroxide stress protein YaaA [Paracoccaceae bacterium]